MNGNQPTERLAAMPDDSEGEKNQQGQPAARLLLLNGGLALLGATGAFFLVHHVQVRVTAWLNPPAPTTRS